MAQDLTAIDAYRLMLTIRRFEERCTALSLEGVFPGSVHTCDGQEAIPVGVRSALSDQDRLLPTYRGHGWAIAAGVPLLGLLAEIAHREGGINGGRAGSPYLTAPDYGLLGENSIVGAGVPIGAGVALAAKLQGTGRIAVVSIGDGAMSQGSVHEGMAFAAAFDLPMIIVVEDNGWSELTETSSLLRIPDFTVRAAGYGISAMRVDGTDPFAVRDATLQAIDQIRMGRGPVLLDCQVARLRGHYNRDIEHYRPAEDKARAAEQDPLVLLGRRLIDGGTPQAQLDAIEAEVVELIDGLTAEVLQMAPPDPSGAFGHVYGPVSATPAVERSLSGSATDLTYQRAVNSALDLELRERPELLVYGEDVGFAGGIFGVSRSLQKSHGDQRVFDVPIAESAILGSAVGAAMEGMRPVVEIMWADFMLVALDQLVNQAANVRYISRSAVHAPMVVRTQQGATPGSCAQHSQSLEALLAHIPGLKLGLPATPADAFAMTRSAIADPDPVVLVEARELYQVSGEVFLDGDVIPVGGARRHRDGSSLAIITWGAPLHRVLSACDELAAEGINATVLDLRWLNPLDEEAIAAAVVAGSGRVLVVHEANETGGFGAEIVARIQARHWSALAGPVVRHATRDTRLPAAVPLQSAVLPTPGSIAEAARALVRGASGSVA